jgi:hypothetical protein
MNRPLRRTGIAVVLTVVTLGGAAAERLTIRPLAIRQLDGPGLSLRVTDEAAPAGSVVQLKIEVTEPKPISTGRGKIKIKGATTVEGIVLMNEGQDTYGLAIVNGDELTFSITSPSSLFGTPADYPILGIAATVANAPVGTTFPIRLDADGLGFRDPSGAVYPTEIKDGTLTVANSVAIGDVSPGSAVVPAGGVVHISGANFTADTRLQLSETSIAEQRFINSHRIDVVLAQTTRMHGLRIRARNDEKGKNGDKSESEYYSYERTAPIGESNDSLLRNVVPLFAPMTYTTATVDLPLQSSGGRRRAVRSGGSASIGAGSAGSAPVASLASGNTTAGFALQNLESSTASVSVELLDRFGNPYAVNTVSIGPDRYLVREISEVFGNVKPASAFRIRSNVPVQLLGLVADHSGGIAAAVPPH